MKINILSIMIVFIFLCSFVSANLGCFKLNDQIQIVVPLNVSSVTLTNVNSPSPNSTIIISNQIMTKNGNLFNYTFSNASTYGTYTYGYCDNEGNCYSNDFLINGSGACITQEQITLIVIGLVIILVFSAFFFILSLLFKHPGTKIFLMALSALTMIVLIGIIAANGNIYLAEFSSLTSIYNTYYIFIISLAGAAMAGIILWLVYYSVMLFNKSRGTIPED